MCCLGAGHAKCALIVYGIDYCLVVVAGGGWRALTTTCATRRTQRKERRPCADLNRDCWIQSPECWPLHHKATGDPSDVSFQGQRQRADAKMWIQQFAHAGNRARGTSMEGLYVTTTLRVPCCMPAGTRQAKLRRLNADAPSGTTRYTTPGQDRTGDLQRVGLTS